MNECLAVSGTWGNVPHPGIEKKKTKPKQNRNKNTCLVSENSVPVVLGLNGACFAQSFTAVITNQDNMALAPLVLAKPQAPRRIP